MRCLFDFRNSFIKHVCDAADYDAAYDAAEKQDAEVGQKSDVLYDGAGHEKLAQVVHYATCHADSHHAEKLCAVEQVHDQKAEHAACQGIEHSEDSAEEESCQDDSDYIYGHGIFEIHAVQCDNDYQVGNTQLDSRHGNREREEGFDVGEHHGQNREDCTIGNQTCAVFSLSRR